MTGESCGDDPVVGEPGVELDVPGNLLCIEASMLSTCDDQTLQNNGV